MEKLQQQNSKKIKEDLMNHWIQINQSAITFLKNEELVQYANDGNAQSVTMISLKQHIMYFNKPGYTNYHAKNGNVAYKTKRLGWSLNFLCKRVP